MSRLLTYLLTYLGLSFHEEHRPSTTTRHRVLFCAALTASCHDLLVFLNSAYVSRRQEFLGRPIFLFPWGFHCRAWRVMLEGGFLRVCPIQRFFLCLIWKSRGCCPAILHRSLLVIFSDHLVLKMRLRHVLWKIWSFCMDAFVVLHVSDPYNYTDLTLELKICSLVEIRMSLEAQIFLA